MGIGVGTVLLAVAIWVLQLLNGAAAVAQAGWMQGGQGEMQELVGRSLPGLGLEATDGTIVTPARLGGTVVIFCYPWTGRPGVANPPNWDDIAGAHGSTPQAQAYSRAYGEFRKLGVKLHGLSFQDRDWQREFAQRCAIAFPLLSDAKREFARALDLPVFETGGVAYLKRLTLIAEDGVIAAVRYPVERPGEDAGEVLKLIKGGFAERAPSGASRHLPRERGG